jgi:hypothetical protein
VCTPSILHYEKLLTDVFSSCASTRTGVSPFLSDSLYLLRLTLMTFLMHSVAFNFLIGGQSTSALLLRVRSDLDADWMLTFAMQTPPSLRDHTRPAGSDRVATLSHACGILPVLFCFGLLPCVPQPISPSRLG